MSQLGTYHPTILYSWGLYSCPNCKASPCSLNCSSSSFSIQFVIFSIWYCYQVRSFIISQFSWDQCVDPAARHLINGQQAAVLGIQNTEYRANTPGHVPAGYFIIEVVLGQGGGKTPTRQPWVLALLATTSLLSSPLEPRPIQEAINNIMKPGSGTDKCKR